jgi:BolA-like protein 1
MANEALIDKLYQELDAQHVDVIDNSWRHAGHVAMRDNPLTEGTHLDVTVVSPKFDGVNLINRHRMVHGALKEAFAGALHALELKTYTPQEWQERQQ